VDEAHGKSEGVYSKGGVPHVQIKFSLHGMMHDRPWCEQKLCCNKFKGHLKQFSSSVTFILFKFIKLQKQNSIVFCLYAL